MDNFDSKHSGIKVQWASHYCDEKDDTRKYCLIDQNNEHGNTDENLFWVIFIQVSVILLFSALSLIFGVFDSKAQWLNYATNPGLLFFFYPAPIVPVIIFSRHFKKLIAQYDAGEILDLKVLTFSKWQQTISIVYFTWLPLLQPLTLRFCNFTITPINTFSLEMTVLATTAFTIILVGIVFVEKTGRIFAIYPV